MTLDEAITYAENVAKEQDKISKLYDDASGYSRSHNDDIRTSEAKECERCAEDHRQLAEWLKDYKRLKEQEPSEDWHDTPSGEMTLEQARQAVRELRKYVMDKIEPCKMREAIQKERERIEQYIDSIAEPCEDCINRQAVLDIVNNPLNIRLDEIIKKLPSVTPQPKIERWIFTDEAHEHARCSNCDYGDVDLMDGKPHNYCQNCGAKIVEPQEESEVEDV